MNFNSGDTPWGQVLTVISVLDFVAAAASWKRQADFLSPEALDGLSIVISACMDTLQEAEKRASPAE